MITAISNNKVQNNTNLKQRTPVFKAKTIKPSVSPETQKESLLSFLLKPFKKLLQPKQPITPKYNETPIEWESEPYKTDSIKIPEKYQTPLEG